MATFYNEHMRTVAAPPGLPSAGLSPANSLRSQRSTSSLSSDHSIYSSKQSSSISAKYDGLVDGAIPAYKLQMSFPEPDDDLHNPDPKRDKGIDRGGRFFTRRMFSNVGCLIFMAIAILGLFVVLPVTTYFTVVKKNQAGSDNDSDSEPIASMPANFDLIDRDTPQEAYTYESHIGEGTYQLVFSDEFNQDGRSFYPGDDPYWEALDLHYWATNNMEWYDPAAVTTRGGNMEITLSRKETHGLSFQGGMVTSWNKFCFTGGIFVASVSLPGRNNLYGLWPAVWTFGNLGRVGYGASLEGMWPYSYDTCDVGTVANQTVGGQPAAAVTNGDPAFNGELSYLPGQRLSACTCPGESHPGPQREDGTFVGRAAPEIDVLEATLEQGEGFVSMTYQVAPFDEFYIWNNASGNFQMGEGAMINPHYRGGVFQQANSALVKTNQDCYELNTGCFSVYGFEYKPGYDDAYISWINDNKHAWTLMAQGLGPNEAVQISQRPISEEPMYLVMNLGMSENFGGPIDTDSLEFPYTMKVDWVRVYQKEDEKDVGCNPSHHPTADYIERYIEAYTNPNLTTWEDDYKQTMPRNSFLGQC